MTEILRPWTDGRASTAAGLIEAAARSRFGRATRWSWRELDPAPADSEKLRAWAETLRLSDVALGHRLAKEAFGLVFLMTAADARLEDATGGTRLWQWVASRFRGASAALFDPASQPKPSIKEAIELAVDRYFCRHALNLDASTHRWWRTTLLHSGWSPMDWFTTVPTWLAGIGPEPALVSALTNVFDPLAYSHAFTQLAAGLRAAYRMDVPDESRLRALAANVWARCTSLELRLVIERARVLRRTQFDAAPDGGDPETPPPLRLSWIPGAASAAEVRLVPEGWADFDVDEPIDLYAESRRLRRVIRPYAGWASLAADTFRIALPAGAEGGAFALRARSGATLWESFVEPEAAPDERAPPAPPTRSAPFELGFGPVRVVGDSSPTEAWSKPLPAMGAGAISRVGWRWSKAQAERPAVLPAVLLVGARTIPITGGRTPIPRPACPLGQSLELVARGPAASQLIDFVQPAPRQRRRIVEAVTATQRITAIRTTSDGLEIGFVGPLEPDEGHSATCLTARGEVFSDLPIVEPEPGKLHVRGPEDVVGLCLHYRGVRIDSAFLTGWWSALEAPTDSAAVAEFLREARAPIESHAADAAIGRFVARAPTEVLRDWTRGPDAGWRAAAQQRLWLDGAPPGFHGVSLFEEKGPEQCVVEADAWLPIWAVARVSREQGGDVMARAHLRERYRVERVQDAMGLWDELAETAGIGARVVRNTLHPTVLAISRGEGSAGKQRDLLRAAMHHEVFRRLAAVATWTTLCPDLSPL